MASKKSFLLILLSLIWLDAVSSKVASECACPLLDQPSPSDKELSARWMVHSLDWGVLSTTSARLPNSPPFGNVYSFVDGSCGISSGTPYFYGSHMDQSFKDMAVNAKASFTLSAAAINSVCSSGKSPPSCIISDRGDPESPMCARLTLTGTLVEVPAKTEEFKHMENDFFQRHKSMASWPEDHEFVIAKLVIEDIWFINYFGGASVLTPDKYFAVNLDGIVSNATTAGAISSSQRSTHGLQTSVSAIFGLLAIIVCLGVGCSRPIGPKKSYLHVETPETETAAYI